MIDRLTNLLTVKSIITIMLTFVFCWMELGGGISSDFMTVYTVVISFYFGTQMTKQANNGRL